MMRNLLFLFISLLLSVNAQAQYNSFHPGEIWKDNNGIHINAHGGGIIKHNNKFYWFGEFKIEGRIGNSAQVGVQCYSSTDLYNWKDEDTALKVVTDKPGHDIEKGCVLERPKVIYNKKYKTFVMWFHLELKGQGYKAAKAGIATAKNITGPYTFIKSVRPNAGKWPLNGKYLKDLPVPVEILNGATERKGFSDHPDSLNFFKRDFEKGQMSRDMTLFLDDDGKAYHIYTSEENSTLHIAELTDDFLSHTGKFVRAFVGRYMEAPAIIKRNKKYYLIASDCTGWKPNAARSAVADNILGPWKELKNPAVGIDSATTFRSQSTYILKADNKNIIFMGDRWTPNNAIDGRYIWLPVEFDGDQPIIKWHDEWKLK